MTLSFLGRVAARYGLDVSALLALVLDVDGRQNLAGVLRPDSEVYLNAVARSQVAALCRVPVEDLCRALPAWVQEEPRERWAPGPAGRLHAGVETVRSWGAGCPGCVAARSGGAVPARFYLAPHARVCSRHQYWLMAVPGIGGRSVDLAGCPEVVQAHRLHLRLLQRSRVGGAAFAVARAVTAGWWAQQWPQERVWPERLAVTVPEGEELGLWRVLAGELVTYPETVAVAGVLADCGVRQRVASDAGGHLPFRLAESSFLLSALSRALGRPWLAESLAWCTSGPLFAWVHRCAVAGGTWGDLWEVGSAHQPRPVVEDMAEYRRGSGGGFALAAAKRRRGHSRQADEAFGVGLIHARAYAAVHGHLSTRKDTVHDGFGLGQWMANQRMHSLAMPTERSDALYALDPWWKTPWRTLWQRTYHQARVHARDYGVLDARQGFPGTGISLGEWLYLQCRRYPELHPEQRRLLAELGVDAAAARAARPRRRNLRAGEQEALSHARRWVAEHGSLARVGTKTVHEGYPLGRWLAGRRSQQGRGVLSADRAAVLSQIDPWWCPPWHLLWQRSFERVQQQLRDVGGDDMSPLFPGLDRSARSWLVEQRRRYHGLEAGQQALLAELGLQAGSSLVATVNATRLIYPHPRPAHSAPLIGWCSGAR